MRGVVMGACSLLTICCRPGAHDSGELRVAYVMHECLERTLSMAYGGVMESVIDHELTVRERQEPPVRQAVECRGRPVVLAESVEGQFV